MKRNVFCRSSRMTRTASAYEGRAALPRWRFGLVLIVVIGGTLVQAAEPPALPKLSELEGKHLANVRIHSGLRPHRKALGVRQQTGKKTHSRGCGSDILA